MDNKISDFKLAESYLKGLCWKNGVSFIDLPIDFEGEKGIKDGFISVDKSKNVAHTIYKIVANYINNSLVILDKDLFSDDSEKENFLINLSATLRGMIYKENTFSNSLEELTLQNLYQKPVVWLLMKNIICPINNISLKNVRIVIGNNAYIDIARYCKKGEIEKDGTENYPFIFLNQIDNNVVSNAFLLVETLKAYDLSPMEVIKDIFESDMYEKFMGLLKLAFDDDDKINEFVCVLINILGINFNDFTNKDIDKFSQAQNPGAANQYWYLGVLDRMLEPIRGTNWSTYFGLETYVEDFWNKVEEVKNQREKKGQDVGVPFDTLLRLKAKQISEIKTDPNMTLQGLLSSNRVW